jgi:toxin ParE1/3/4
VVIWSAPAKADLRSIHDFITTDSRHYAKKVVQDLIDKTDILDRLPRIGRVVPELGDDNIRELLPYSYRVIYEIKGEVVVVLAVIHKRRELQAGMIQQAGG